jgi:hypothetical protein
VKWVIGCGGGLAIENDEDRPEEWAGTGNGERRRPEEWGDQAETKPRLAFMRACQVCLGPQAADSFAQALRPEATGVSKAIRGW